MRRLIVREFGSTNRLVSETVPDPVPTPGTREIVVRLTSIGMNHADLLTRKGYYKLASGEPPFVPGLEGGGYVHSVAEGVTERKAGQRVILGLNAPTRPLGLTGTYQTHYLTTVEKTVLAPDGIPDELLGVYWQPYITPWGCIVWKAPIKPGSSVLLSAASSSVALAASQVFKNLYSCRVFATTTSEEKLEKLRSMPEAQFDHVFFMDEKLEWARQIKDLTARKGVDVVFTSVTSGEFMDASIQLLARNGVVWLYGLLGHPGIVNLRPLIRKSASVRGWGLTELILGDNEGLNRAYDHVLKAVQSGIYKLPIGGIFSLEDAQRAQEEMEKGQHIGKFVLVP